MDDRFIFTNCIGTFLFENGKVSDKLLFSDVQAANKILKDNGWTEEEKKLASKVEGKILFLGIKNKKPDNVAFTNDVRKLSLAGKALSQYDAETAKATISMAKVVVKESVHSDELAIQAISAIQDLDKVLSILTKRLREWYGLQNPESALNVSDSQRLVNEVLEGGSVSRMQAKLNNADRAEIKELAGKITGLMQLRSTHEKYLEARMKETCPNLVSVAGASIGAKLLRAAGSLKSLATMPASTLQLLGAERAMFNFLRKKSKKMPRFGILHEHRLIAASVQKKKGKAARLLADKISIAARVDYFRGDFVGDRLLKEVESKIK